MSVNKIAMVALAGVMAAAVLAATPAVSPAWAQRSPEAVGGEAYRLGRYQEAIDIWRGAAADGDAGSAWRMAQEYLDGKYLTRDLKKALEYLDVAVAQGYAPAEAELADLYDSGVGLRRNKKRAAELYLRAANKGHGHAQFNIAVMLETGDGIKRNRVEAYKFFLLARERGFGPFVEPNLVQLARRMSKDDIAAAIKLAEEWSAAY